MRPHGLWHGRLSPRFPPPFALIMCHFGVFLPCTSPHLVMVGPRELAGMGPRGFWCWRMMDTSPCWSGKTAGGRRKVVALLQAPDVLPQHLLITQTLAEEQSQGRGEGLSEWPWGSWVWRDLTQGPSCPGQAGGPPTQTLRSPLGFSAGHLRGPPPLCGRHQLPRPAPGPGGQLLVCGSLFIPRFPRVTVAKGKAWVGWGCWGDLISLAPSPPDGGRGA